MHLGIAHHYGWAVAVTATSDHQVVDRRRIELIEPDLPAAPVHHEGGPHELHRGGEPLGDEQLAALVATVRASMVRATAVALDGLAAEVAGIVSISVRAWPDEVPTDVSVLRRAPWESRVDSYRYCQVLAELGTERGWTVCTYDATRVLADATALLGDRADEVLQAAPRRALGAPWAKDHRIALAATVVA